MEDGYLVSEVGRKSSDQLGRKGNFGQEIEYLLSGCQIAFDKLYVNFGLAARGHAMQEAYVFFGKGGSDSVKGLLLCGA
ncbi:hypothetical protein D9M72_536950 [compost metagenome]